MQLLLEHAQKGKVFSLWAKYELMGQEQKLVEQYNIRDVVLVEGNPRQERERAMKLAGALSVVVFLLGFAAFGQPVAGITLALIAFPIAWIVIYNHIRETIRVEDILNGRHFACRSILTLLEKKQQISEMAEKFTQFLEVLKNWGGREVIEMAPDRPPSARFVERPRAAE
jgi:hypothetical protein